MQNLLKKAYKIIRFQIKNIEKNQVEDSVRFSVRQRIKFGDEKKSSVIKMTVQDMSTELSFLICIP